jgi:hypothetical protein
LVFGQRTEKTIIIDVEGEDDDLRERTMRFWITPVGRDLIKTNDRWDSIEVTLNFEWEVYRVGGTTLKEGAVRLVKTNVAEY